MKVVNDWIFCFEQPALATKRRNIFTAIETDRGDVLIVIPVVSYTPELVPEEATQETHPLEEVREYRWSIHPSPDSPKAVNHLKKHILVRGAEKETFRLVTSTIKAKSGFQPIFARRCPDLEHAKCNVAANAGNVVTLAAYDHRLFTPTIQVFVGHREVPFKLPSKTPDISFRQFVINDFKFVILTSFYPFYATDRGLLMDVETMDPGPEYVGKFGHSLSAAEAVDFFRRARGGGLVDLQRQFPKALAHPFYGPMLRCGIFVGSPSPKEVERLGVRMLDARRRLPL